jgi:hypothetical protein
MLIALEIRVPHPLFIALWQAQHDAGQEATLRLGSRVLILAFGAGFTWGTHSALLANLRQASDWSRHFRFD